MVPTIKDIINRIQRDKKELGITTNNPASESEILSFENAKKIKRPGDIKTFYRFCNGFESEEDMFRIIPLEEIIENKTDDYLINSESFHIAEYMIYCDMWTVSIDKNSSDTYSVYNKVENVITLTKSFSEFLNVFLNDGVFAGLYDWRKRLESLTERI